MYFKNHPTFVYDFQYNIRTYETRTSIVKDITENVRFRKEVLENVTAFDEYDIVDGETPEIIAEKIYGNPEYHWILMLANQRWDYRTDFPLTDRDCVKACAIRYNPQLQALTWLYDSTTRTVTVTDITKVVPVTPDPANFPYQYALPHGLLASPTTTVTITGGNLPNGTFTIADVPDLASFTYVLPDGVAEPSLNGETDVQFFIKTTGRENYIAQWETPDGFVVNSDYPGAVSLTNHDIAIRENEAKRRIKIISPNIISAILKNYKDLI
jgi:hypothetical protein